MIPDLLGPPPKGAVAWRLGYAVIGLVGHMIDIEAAGRFNTEVKTF
jgi:hypothetical protein